MKAVTCFYLDLEGSRLRKEKVTQGDSRKLRMELGSLGVLIQCSRPPLKSEACVTHTHTGANTHRSTHKPLMGHSGHLSLKYLFLGWNRAISKSITCLITKLLQIPQHSLAVTASDPHLETLKLYLKTP